jgi:ADP-ribosylation factor protein 1
MGNKGGKAHAEATILMAGAPDCGKTSLLYQMKFGEICTTVPTNGFNCESIHYQKFDFTIYGMLCP